MSKKKKFSIKWPKTELGKTITPVIAMTEELNAENHIPYAIIGIKHMGGKQMHTLFSTVNDEPETLKAICDCCKALLISQGYTVNEPEPTTP